MAYDIQTFWKHRLTVSARGSSGSLQGWQHIETGLPTFLEAPLSLASGFGNSNPKESAVILISAPGAVGKSTLARQIAFETGAMLLDLAASDPVGANTLVGGLARSYLYEPFQRGEAALIVDGLDEARMRVTQDSFAAFMRDVVELANVNGNPIVLLGRTGAAQEAWLWLTEQDIEAPVLEIGYYNVEQAAKFAKLQAQYIRKETYQREPDGRAIELLLERLRTQTLADGGTFAGYSPVLIAVAKQVADPNNTAIQNTQELISRIERGVEQITLNAIAQSILLREQTKLHTLHFEDKTLRDKLYTPEEQLLRLVARLYKCSALPAMPQMSAADEETYSNALDSWLSDHPFLDGEGHGPSSAVFGGLIATKALRAEASHEAVLSIELSRGTAINPFLAEFYIADLNESERGTPFIPAAHVGILYTSLRARLALGETADLRIDGEIEDVTDDEETEVEITRSKQNGEEFMPLRFSTEINGHIRFGPHVEDVDITAPHARVSMSYSSEIALVAPVFIDVAELIFDTDRVVIEAVSRLNSAPSANGGVVFLKAGKLNAPRVASRPMRRGDVTLGISWPGSKAFPWTEFAVTEQDTLDPRIDEALRRLKKILRLFRSHSRNQLAKYRHAIDHRRRTKGVGRYVLDQLLEEKIITVQGPMYFLNPDKLVANVGLTFHDMRMNRVTQNTIEFLNRALARDN